MTNKIYVLYNNKTKRYGDVWASPSDAWAEKSTHKMLEAQGNDLEDLELCRAGEIDIETGVIEAATAPIRIAWSMQEVKMPLRETEPAKTE